MTEQNNPSGKHSQSRTRWIWYRILLALIPASIPFAYFYLTGREAWSLTDFAVVFGLFVAYWLIVMMVLGRSLRGRQALHAARLASPLIEVPLSADLRARLSGFAASRRQKLAVAGIRPLDEEVTCLARREKAN